MPVIRKRALAPRSGDLCRLSAPGKLRISINLIPRFRLRPLRKTPCLPEELEALLNVTRRKCIRAVIWEFDQNGLPVGRQWRSEGLPHLPASPPPFHRRGEVETLLPNRLPNRLLDWHRRQDYTAPALHYFRLN